MTERAYTVVEIDRMRAAVESMLGTERMIQVDRNRWTGPQRNQEFFATIEDRLRTYMIAGTDPDELFAHAVEKTEKRFKAVYIEALRPIVGLQDCKT